MTDSVQSKEKQLLNNLNVRSILSSIRNKWEAHTPLTPMMLSEEVACGLSIAEFSHAFIISHHTTVPRKHDKK